MATEYSLAFKLTARAPWNADTLSIWGESDYKERFENRAALAAR